MGVIEWWTRVCSLVESFCQCCHMHQLSRGFVGQGDEARTGGLVDTAVEAARMGVKLDIEV